MVFNWLGVVACTLKLISSHTLKLIYLMPMAYERPADLEALARAFVEQDLIKRFKPEILGRLWAHHQLGNNIVIISASCTFYLKFVSRYLPDHILIGTQLLLPSRGFFRFPSYSPQEGNMKGENKVTYLKNREDMLSKSEGSFAYSDSIADKPLLEFSKYPVAVDPGKRLRALSHKRGWEIIHTPGCYGSLKVASEKALLLLFTFELGQNSSAISPEQFRHKWDGDEKLRDSMVKEIEYRSREPGPIPDN